MFKIFDHTFWEPGMWRGWFRNGQALELCWRWIVREFGVGLLIHSNESGKGNRILCLKCGWFSAYIPLGITSYDVDINDEPHWSAFASKEFGLWLRWGRWSKRWDWPFHTQMLEWEYQTNDGWASNLGCSSWDETALIPGRPNAFVREYDYRYVLRSGVEQHVTARVVVERMTFGRHLLHHIGWPVRVKKSINVNFSGEVGEEAGSWKGGCIGCSYDMLPNEMPVQTLRRMERDRKF